MQKNNCVAPVLRRLAFWLMLVALAMVAAPLSAPLMAQNFAIPSRCEANAAISTNQSTVRVCSSEITKTGCEQHSSCWWRDTSYQNSLWAHTVEQSPNRVLTPYSDTGVSVKVFASQAGVNVVLVHTYYGNIIVGTGGSPNAAQLAKYRFSQVFPDFEYDVAALIYPTDYPESYWGGKILAGRSTRALTVFARKGSLDASPVATAMVQRKLYAYGPELPYGPNGNLGVGWAFGFMPYQTDPQICHPPNDCGWGPYSQYDVEGNPTFWISNLQVQLISTKDGNGLIVWLPVQKVAIAGLMGKFLSVAGDITRPNVDVTALIQDLDVIRGLGADVLVPQNGLPVIGATNVSAALTDQRNALQSVFDQTIDNVNLMMPLDDIVAQVRLPSPLAASPYVQQFATEIPEAVRAIYHHYMGWFDDDPAKLETMSANETALRMMDLGGGEGSVLDHCRRLIADHTRSSTQTVLYLLSMHRRVFPNNGDADRMYVQALRMLAYTTPSGQLRNYYLVAAQRAEAAMQ